MTDDQLIRKFMLENSSEPQDNGFSQRVTQRLPRRPISAVWTTVAELTLFIIGSIILLSQVDLTQVFCNLSVRTLQFVAYLKHVEININPIYTVVTLTLLTVWGGKKIKEV